MAEHLKYGGPELCVHLSLLFNAMLKHSFVPDEFAHGVIIPLLKDKHGDSSKLDMYRGISHFDHLCLNCLNKYYYSCVKNNYPLTSYSLGSRNIMAVLMHYLP